MKKTIFVALILVAALSIWAQGLETFDNFDYTGTNYIDGSFVGEDGIEWFYTHSRGSTAQGDSFPIDGNGMMLRRSGNNSKIVSESIPGGISNFSVQMRKAHTSGGDRQLALYINDNLIAESQTFGSTSGVDDTIHDFVVNGINIPGDIVIEIRHIQGGDQNRQLVIDNITWTEYGSGMSFVSNPTFNPPAGHYDEPIDVEITTSTDGASIYYTLDGTIPSQQSTLYVGSIALDTPTTIKAIGYADGYEPSAVVTADYGFVIPVDNLAVLRMCAPDNNTVYKLTGDAILTYKRTSRNQKYVQDSVGAILIDDAPGVITTNYEIGDAINGLTGKLSQYYETLQFIPTADPGPAASSGNPIYETVLTVAALNADSGIFSYQSRLVTILDVSIQNASGSFEGGQNYDLADATGLMTFRTAFTESDYLGSAIPTEPFTVRGLIGNFQETVQITPRNLADFNPVSNDDDTMTPAPVKLIGNYPNPFNPETTIQFQMETAAPANISIYNQRGQLVKSHNIAQANAGMNSYVWNGQDDSGNSLSSGIYFFRLKSGAYSSSKKMILMK